MAKKVTTVTELTDDIDGGPASKTLSFSWDGTSYEIDLNAENATTLSETMESWVQYARKAGSASRRGGRAAATKAKAELDLGAVREWAKSKGIKVAERGRVAAGVIEQYQSAH